MLHRFFKRILLPPLIILAALIMFFEEWLWNKLVRFTKWVAKAPFFRWIEARLTRLPPYGAMAVLLVPAAMLLPVKIIALYLMTHHRVKTGIMIILAAKVIGTAIVARLFTICRPALLSIQWFRRLFEGIVNVKNRLYKYIKSMAAWKVAVRIKNRIKSWMPRGGRFRRMWKALGEVLRKKFFPKKRGLHADGSPAEGTHGGPAAHGEHGDHVVRESHAVHAAPVALHATPAEPPASSH